jgi:hypothetical protein
MRFFKRRRPHDPNNTPNNAAQMMNLSLFIMLLAFFIVLNSLSTFEENKSEKIRRSVQMAFTTLADPGAPAVTDSPEQGLREGHTFDRLDALFRSQIVNFESETSKLTGRMQVQVPYDVFMEAILAEGQVDFFRFPTRREIRDNFFLPTLVSLISADLDGAPTRLEVTIHTEAGPGTLQNENQALLNEKINAVGQVSRRLDAQGLPQKLLNIGIEQGDPAFVQLTFIKYAPFSPVMEK